MQAKPIGEALATMFGLNEAAEEAEPSLELGQQSSTTVDTAINSSSR